MKIFTSLLFLLFVVQPVQGHRSVQLRGVLGGQRMQPIQPMQGMRQQRQQMQRQQTEQMQMVQAVPVQLNQGTFMVSAVPAAVPVYCMDNNNSN